MTDEDKKEEQSAEDTGEGDKSEATELIEQQSERIKELETERDKRIMDDAKKQMHGTAEGGQKAEKPKEETPREYADRMVQGL
ncbi:MAG: hypothetical protein KJI69_06045 [Patescibacteria group bacterium]|nr:hypothetical protein [Patescibacteria group bacterium]